jgi:hypothetical protein
MGDTPTEKFSLCNLQLFLCHHSSKNYLITDPSFQTWYLAKYAAGIDKNRNIKIIAGKDKDEIEVVQETVQHTKVTGSNITQQEVL